MRMLLFFITMCFVACGTDQGELKTYRYTVRNETGVQIEVKSFNTNNPNSILSELTIDNSQEITKNYQDAIPQRGYGFDRFFGSSNGFTAADSIIIIFNSEKSKSYKLETRCEVGDERNPLNTCFHNNNEEETFIFTIEDYQNAEDCNGNCD